MSEGGESVSYVHVTRLHNTASPTSSSFPRPTSPDTDIFPRHPVPSDGQVQRGMKFTKNTELESPGSRSHSNDKGKQPLRASTGDSGSNFGNEQESPQYSGFLSNEKARPPTVDTNVIGRNKFRESFLGAASDAFGFRFGRRRPSVRQPPMSIVFPDVIEISAAHHDEEVEERNRLKQMAAEAIGLGPFMVSPDAPSREDSATDEDDEELEPTPERAEAKNLGYGRNPESSSNIAERSSRGSSLSVVIPSPALGGRFRSGSMLTHRHSNSLTMAPIPPFPSTVASLTSFKQSVGVFPKYYPPSSLRIFALSRNWKNRYLILSSPATLVTRGQGPAVSYLHLFKSSNRDDKELERLEINEDSVVFVSEEEVGGKRHVIKVGGADVGAMKKEYTHEEGGHTMWLLQIPDQIEAQSWITNIKNAILGQRTVRAGLIPAHTLGNNEPRGDMDVMLSIRAQGLVTVPSSPTRVSHIISPVPTYPGEARSSYAPSISSHSARSQSVVSKSPPSPGAVSALKGLFANSRPRSPSRAASIESERQQERDGQDESFTSMGSNLLSMLRSGTPDTQSIVTLPSTPVMRNLPFAGPVNPVERRIDRKILADRQPFQWASTEPVIMHKDRSNKALSLGALPLQPPPRKRWISVGPATFVNQECATQPRSINVSRRTSLSPSVVSIEKVENEPTSSPGHLSGFQFGTPEDRPRAPSLQSVSTYASNENTMNLDSSSMKRNSGTRSRRWSRQGILPIRLTPPSDPPPAIPTSQPSSSSSTLSPITNRAPSPAMSSQSSSHKSTVSGLPTFNKRASGSSVRSFSSLNTSHSNPGSTHSNMNPGPINIRSSASHRLSMPPPRPAPTSALPPAPTDANHDLLKISEPISSSKPSFRNSVAHRSFRHSMIAAPQPPPSTTLPPRPDEPEYRTHRRSISSGHSANSINPLFTKLETIPASPIPPAKLVNPFPPPIGPLPPTPPAIPNFAPSKEGLPPPKRTTSIKDRLRIRSTSTPSGSQQPNLHFTRPFTTFSSAALSTSPPATPIAEKITMFQNDPSFLHMHTPVLPSMPPPQALLPFPRGEMLSEVTSLSPPPRRGSKLLETDLLNFKTVSRNLEGKLATAVEGSPRHLSLSRSGSMTSNNSRQSQENFNEYLDSPTAEMSPASTEELAVDKFPSPIEARHMSLSRTGSVVSLGIVSI